MSPAVQRRFVLYTLAQVAITFAGFSGVVVAFGLLGEETSEVLHV
jgi:hypothetical protein